MALLTRGLHAGAWDVPLPEDMEALMQGLLAEADMAPDSLFCSSAFQKDLHAFLHAQVPTPLIPKS